VVEAKIEVQECDIEAVSAQEIADRGLGSR
jgi:hypothetical protein